MRDRIRAGSLLGEQDDRGRWWIPAAALPATRQDDRDITGRVAALEREVETLSAGRADHERLVAAVMAERDRFRADAIAARDAALQVNSANAELRATMRGLIKALDAQADALTQMLVPGSPEGLP